MLQENRYIKCFFHTLISLDICVYSAWFFLQIFYADEFFLEMYAPSDKKMLKRVPLNSFEIVQPLGNEAIFVITRLFW